MSSQGYPRRSVYSLSVLVLVAFGVSLYAMSVLLTERGAGGEFSIALLSLGFGGSALIAGLLAPAVGRYADDHSVRGLMLAGSVLGAAAMVTFSLATTAWQAVAVLWLLMGPASAMTLYEPAYVAVSQWVPDVHRNRAIAALSLIAGLAGPVFVPLAGAMVTGWGWRWAAAALGGIYLATGVLSVAMYPDHKPAEHREHDVPPVDWSRFFHDRRLGFLTIAVVLTFAAMNSVFFHRVAVFEEQGFEVATVALLAGLSGLLTFPGRYMTPLIAERVPGTTLFTIACAGIVVAMVFAVVGSTMVAMLAFFAVFGVFFGFLLPTRAVIMNDWYHGEDYGAVMGKQWAVAAVAGGITPFLVGFVRDALGSYTVPLIVLTIAVAVAGMSNELAARSSRISAR